MKPEDVPNINIPLINEKKEKVCRHPKVDMGVPPPVKGAEASARAGAIFDPKLFKGNC